MEFQHWGPGWPATAQLKLHFALGWAAHGLEPGLDFSLPPPLLEGAKKEVDQREPEDQGKQPALPGEETAPRPGG